MLCNNCGRQLSKNETVCPKCGALIKNNFNISKKPDEFDGESTTKLLFHNSFSEKNTNIKTETDPNKTELLTGDDKTVLLGSDNAPDNTEVICEGRNIISNSSEGDTSLNSMSDIFGSTYKIIGIVGKGGFGVVYKALHTRLNKEVVIKQIADTNTKLNHNETDLLKKLKHSYLPQVFDCIEYNGNVYTVMDFISGSDTEKLVDSGRKFKIREVIRIARQLCEAVGYLHRQKPPIIHSDIKPSNVMLSDNGNICLIDFNVSLVFDKDAAVIGGTRGFAPPEQLGILLSDIKSGFNEVLPIGKTKPYVNERSDVYSIGAFIYFMITGQRPAANYICRPLTEFDKNIPDGLLHIVSKAMMPEPAKRYKNAGEMLTALKKIGTLDRRYKAMRVQRAVVTVVAAALVIGFMGLSRAGSRKLAEEHEEKYQGYVTEIGNKVAVADYDGAKEIIAEAEKFEPLRIEPYYNDEKIIYLTKNYEECMNYPESALNTGIIENEFNSMELTAEMYEMAADSAFQLENYERSAALYENTLKYSDKLVDCYRDLTISYARLGLIDKAEETLRTAEELGISSDKLELMSGEISAAKGDTDNAYNSFVKVLELTDDDYIRFRALLVCDKLMLSDLPNAKNNAEKMTALLEAQLSKTAPEYTQTVTEMLANEYSRAENYAKAAECYEKLLSQGTLSYSLQKNYFNLMYSKLQKYDKCLDLLGDMSNLNPDDYWVDMNSCYVKISVENEKENQAERDYYSAYESFKTAEQKYSAFTLNGKSDANMDSLRETIRELKSYGWIRDN